MKKLAIAVAVLGGLVLGQKALAANPVTIDVYAQIDNTLSVVVAPGSTWYDFGTVGTGAVLLAAGAINVTNDGGGLNETFGLMLTDPADWTSIVAGAPAAEQFKLRAAWDADGLAIAFVDADHAIGLANANSDATKFASDQTGINVPQSDVRNLWFELSTPASTIAANQQRIVVTVTASAT